jgi:hypothetical protein
LKKKLEIERFSDRKENTLYQNYFITVIRYNMITIAANAVQFDIDEKRKHKNNIYRYKVNFNYAVGVFKNRLALILLEKDPEKKAQYISLILLRLQKHLIPIRPNRSVHRNPCPRKSKATHNQKSNC